VFVVVIGGLFLLNQGTEGSDLSISNTDVLIFLVSQHIEPINSTSIHICKLTLM